MVRMRANLGLINYQSCRLLRGSLRRLDDYDDDEGIRHAGVPKVQSVHIILLAYFNIQFRYIGH